MKILLADDKNTGLVMSDNATSIETGFRRSFCFAFIPFSIAFIASSFFRSVNAVLIPTFEQQFHFSASDIGFITSTFFIAFALFQIPLGILLDRYGARLVNASLMLITCIGLIWYGSTKSIWQLAAAHALMGIGVSGSLMAALKAIIQNFSKERMPMLNGIMMMSGGLGILLATRPAALLAEHYQWHEINYLFAIVTFFIALMIFILVPRNSSHLQSGSVVQHINGLGKIYRDRFFWSVAPLVVISLGSFLAIQSLWVETILRDTQHLNQFTINTHLEIIAIARTLSLLSTGYIEQLAKRLNVTLIQILLINTILYVAIQIGLMLQLHGISYLLWFGYGFFSQIYNISYVILADHYPNTHSGRANAALNVLTFSSVFVIQILMGSLLHHYRPDIAYPVIWCLIITLQCLTGLLTYYLSQAETNCINDMKSEISN